LCGEGGTTGRGADAVHTRELGLLLEEPPRLESRVSACGRDLDVDSGESPWVVSDDEWREFFVERESDDRSDESIDGRAALRATLRPRCATRGRPLVPGRKSGVGRSRIASPGNEVRTSKD